MSTQSVSASRRRFLKLAGGTVALIPLVNLHGCADEGAEQGTADSAPAQAQPEPPPQPATASPPPTDQQTETAPEQPGAAGGPNGAQTQGQLAKLEESDPQAQALGYKHSAEEVDQSAFPSYQAGQLCSNCTLFQPELGEDPWGGCQIFPGKLVNANGWCSAYVPAG